MVTDEDVQQLARRGRVAPHPSYHAHQHTIRFEEILAGLCWCFRVEADPRGHEASKDAEEGTEEDGEDGEDDQDEQDEQDEEDDAGEGGPFHDAAGSHPQAYMAWCPYKGKRILRVDFDLQERDDGDLILVVTAFEVD